MKVEKIENSSYREYLLMPICIYLCKHLYLFGKVQAYHVEKDIGRFYLVVTELYYLLLHHFLLRLVEIAKDSYFRVLVIFIRLFRNIAFIIMFVDYFGIKYLYVLLIIFIIIFVLYYLYCKLYKKMSKVDFWKKQLLFVNAIVSEVKPVLRQRIGIIDDDIAIKKIEKIRKQLKNNKVIK